VVFRVHVFWVSHGIVSMDYMVEINRLDQLVRTFVMKDMGAEK
jgi:hypothetical protein